MAVIRILGIDPGSRYMGYGVIEQEGSRLKLVDANRLVLGNAPLSKYGVNPETIKTQK